MIDEKIDKKDEHSFKILQAAKWYFPEVGGIETVAIAITEAVRQRAEMKILVCSGGKDNKTEISADGVYIYRAKTPFKVCSTPISFFSIHLRSGR